jgi:hypothetical protein
VTIASVKKAGFEADLRQGDPDDPIPALLAVTDKHGNRVDLLAGLRGLDMEAFARAMAVLLGSSLRVIGRINIDLLRRLSRRFGRPAADVLDQVLG